MLNQTRAQSRRAWAVPAHIPSPASRQGDSFCQTQLHPGEVNFRAVLDVDPCAGCLYCGPEIGQGSHDDDAVGLGVDDIRVAVSATVKPVVLNDGRRRLETCRAINL